MTLSSLWCIITEVGDLELVSMYNACLPNSSANVGGSTLTLKEHKWLFIQEHNSHRNSSYFLIHGCTCLSKILIFGP